MEVSMAREILIKGYTILIDDEDYDKVMQYSWRVSKIGPYFRAYVFKCMGKQYDISLHRLIMDIKHGNPICVDHINHNTLDNRKCNLRLATKAQNCRNRNRTPRTLPYKGIRVARGKYAAHIGINERYTYIGTASTMEEAAQMYDLVSIRLYGEFACPNFPIEAYSTFDLTTRTDVILEQMQSKHRVTNTSGYIGVTYRKERKKWQAVLRHEGVMYFLGNFPLVEDAARAYDRKAIELRGIDATLNFPIEDYKECI